MGLHPPGLSDFQVLDVPNAGPTVATAIDNRGQGRAIPRRKLSFPGRNPAQTLAIDTVETNRGISNKTCVDGPRQTRKFSRIEDWR